MTIDDQTATEDTSVVDRGPWSYSTDPELVADPFPTWDKLREESRAFSSSLADDWTVWCVTRYDDVREAMRRPELFSSRSVVNVYEGPKLIDPEEAKGAHRMIPEELDPPEHGLYRHLLTPLFSPQKIAAMEDSIRDWCVDLVDRLAPTGGCDLNADFARQFPTMIFLRMMGVPQGGAEEFLAMVNNRNREFAELAESQGMAAPGAGGAYMMTMFEYMNTVIEERRTERRDDIASYLLDVELEGRKLNDQELSEISTLLYVAGLDTVAGQLGYMFHHLATHAEHRRIITDDPTKISGFVEECLRMYSIVTTNRIVTTDTTFAGCPMKAGDRLVISMPAADRDPREFPDAHVFDMDRPVNRHLAFGAGPHRCLGSHLARLELNIAVEEWTKRIPDYRLADDAEVTFHVGGVAGVDSLPLVWNA